MLVLTRKKNQSVMLGDNVKITVLEVTDDLVKLGIDAPREMTVLRSELYQSVLSENRSAAAFNKSNEHEIKTSIQVFLKKS